MTRSRTAFERWGARLIHAGLTVGARVVLLGLITGCTLSQIPFEREDDFVEREGVDVAQQQMTEVLRRSYKPATDSVAYKPDRIIIVFKYDDFDKTVLAHRTSVLEFVYTEIARITPYNNGRVFVHHVDGYAPHINFRNPEDAVTFTRLLYALKTSQRNQGISALLDIKSMLTNP